MRNWRLAKLNFLCFRLLEIEFSCLEILKQKSILLDHTVTEDASLIIDNLCFHLMEFRVEKNQLMRVCFSFKRSHSFHLIDVSDQNLITFQNIRYFSIEEIFVCHVFLFRIISIELYMI